MADDGVHADAGRAIQEASFYETEYFSIPTNRTILIRPRVLESLCHGVNLLDAIRKRSPKREFRRSGSGNGERAASPEFCANLGMSYRRWTNVRPTIYLLAAEHHSRNSRTSGAGSTVVHIGNTPVAKSTVSEAAEGYER